jgi:hypothetical protein
MSFKPSYTSKRPITNGMWGFLSQNPNAVLILEKHPDKIDWFCSSGNPRAISILKKQLKLHWKNLSQNPNALHLLFPLDYGKMKKNIRQFSKELTEYVFHPVRLGRLADKFQMEFDEYIELFL